MSCFYKKPIWWVVKFWPLRGHGLYKDFMPRTPPMQGGGILLNKSLSCSVEQVIIDPGGRYVILILEMYAQHWQMVNEYIPPPFDSILYTQKISPPPNPQDYSWRGFYCHSRPQYGLF